MDRAEKLAMEQYPVPKDNIFANSVRNALRAAFQLGYLTAEQDLALTWEDMKALDHIMNEVEFSNIQAENVGKELPYPDDKAFYGEILRRFNSQREKK